MSRFPSIVFLALCSSCTILEDTDIASVNQIKKLRLENITITQKLNSGLRKETAVATDSTLDIVFSLGKLTKQTKIQWPNVLPDSKLKFRSGATSSITIKNRFFDSGQIRSCWVFNGSTMVEQYYFTYNQGKLQNISTNITNGTTTFATSDVCNAEGMPIFRNSPDPARKKNYGSPTPLSINTCDLSVVLKSKYNNQTQRYQDSVEYNYCAADNFYIYPSAASVDFFTVENQLLEEVYLGDRRHDTDKNCCGDQYYFHPFLLLSTSQYDLSNRPLFMNLMLKVLYAPDWWEVRNNGSTTPDADQSVKLNFIYGL